MADSCECNGSGFRYVTERYVDAHAPWTMPPIGDPVSDEEVAINEAVEAEDKRRRAAVANSVYPCPIHNTDLYERWRNGTWPRRIPGGDEPAPRAAPQDAEPEPVSASLDDWNHRRRDLQ